jgi:hypothetical protein
LEILVRDRQVRAGRERSPDGSRDVDRLWTELGSVGRIDARFPVRILCSGDDQPFERQLGRPARRFGLHQRLPARRLLRLRLHHIDRRHGPDFDARLVVLHELGREIERLARDVNRLDRVNEVPIRVPHVGQRVDDRRLQLRFGDVLIQLRHDDRLPRRVDLEAAQNRLRVLHRIRRVVRGIQRRRRAVGHLSVVVQRQRVPTAAPAQILRETGVTGRGRVGDPQCAARHALQRVGRRVHHRLTRHLRGEGRLVRSLQAGDREVERLRVQPLHGDIEVAIQCQLHGIVERHVHHGARRPWRYLLRLGRGRLARANPLGRGSNQFLNARIGGLRHSRRRAAHDDDDAQ